MPLICPMTEEYDEYLRDESRSQGQAHSISFPQGEEDIIQILKELHKSRTPITLQGGRTGLAAGAVPNGGHILNLTPMNKITGLRLGEDGCFYLRAEPGLVLLSLNKALESKNIAAECFDDCSKEALRALYAAPEQFFPTDPTETSATIGGIAACNASGARSYLYGSARNYIEALRLVLADGQTMHIRRGQSRAKGRSLTLVSEEGTAYHLKLPTYTMPKTKNASGYYIEDNMDAIDLFIGSDGTLGVITEIELKLLPLPAVIWGVSCFTETEEQATNLVIAARRELKNIAAIEYFDEGALAVLRRQKQQGTAFSQLPEIREDFKAAVYFELHCREESQATTGLFALGDFMKQVGANPYNTWVAKNNADRDRLIFFRHAVPEAVNMLIDERKKHNPALTKLGTDMSVPDEHLPFIMHMYRSMLTEYGLESAIWGHIGDNHLHVNILPHNNDDFSKGKDLYRQWAAITSSKGGAVSAEHGLGKLKADFLPIMYGEEHVKEMARVKQALDKYRQLSPGNMFKTQLTEPASKKEVNG